MAAIADTTRASASQGRRSAKASGRRARASCAEKQGLVFKKKKG